MEEVNMVDRNLGISNLDNHRYESSTKLSNVDFLNKAVEFDVTPLDVASPEASLLLMGPARFLANDPNMESKLKFFGACPGYQVSEGMEVTPIKTVGTCLTIAAAGRRNYTMSLSKLLTRYADLKGSIYKHLATLNNSNTMMLSHAPSPNGSLHYSGFESEIYKIPFGILEIVATSSGEIIRKSYLEECLLRTVSDTVQAQEAFITDNAVIYVNRNIPVVTSVGDSALASIVSTAQQRPYILGT